MFSSTAHFSLEQALSRHRHQPQRTCRPRHRHQRNLQKSRRLLKPRPLHPQSCRGPASRCRCGRSKRIPGSWSTSEVRSHVLPLVCAEAASVWERMRESQSSRSLPFPVLKEPPAADTPSDHPAQRNWLPPQQSHLEQPSKKGRRSLRNSPSPIWLQGVGPMSGESRVSH